MKKIIETDEKAMEGLLGEEVLIFCANYIYAGKLIGVNDSCVVLEGARIVYETGPYTEKGYKDAQALPGKTWNVALGLIESFGHGK